MGRPKLVQDEELLETAREVFIEKGIGASTREIAKRAGISEATIYLRHPTKADLFFAAMVPPALNVEELLADGGCDLSVPDYLEKVALGMLQYFRELMPIIIPLMTHPSFDFEIFAQCNPDTPLNRIRKGLMQYFNTQIDLGNISSDNAGPASLALIASLHSLATFELLGVHGGEFNDDTVLAMVRALWKGLAP